MKCSIMLHFIWVFTVCQSTRLGVSSIQRVKDFMRDVFSLSFIMLFFKHESRQNSRTFQGTLRDSHKVFKQYGFMKKLFYT